MNTHDFLDGTGPVPAHQHPNGGGWVANTAHVDESAFVGADARVYGTAMVYGDARVSGTAMVSTECGIAWGALGTYTWTHVPGHYFQFGCVTRTLAEWRDELAELCRVLEPEKAKWYLDRIGVLLDLCQLDDGGMTR